MNPFVAADGSKHTNQDTMKRANARHASQQKPAQQQAKPGYGDDGGQGDSADPQDGAAMAAEHGPAIEIDVQHDHEGGKHSVHAVHPDGHAHDSEHGSAAEAHKFAADVAGVGSEGAGDGGGDMGAGPGSLGM